MPFNQHFYGPVGRVVEVRLGETEQPTGGGKTHRYRIRTMAEAEAEAAGFERYSGGFVFEGGARRAAREFVDDNPEYDVVVCAHGLHDWLIYTKELGA